jgi:HSP20 family molecular chaperone IbpA
MIIWTTRHPSLAGDFADESEASTDAEWRPDLDIYETPDEFLLVVCVPGVSAEDLDVSVFGHRLTIAGRRVTELPQGVRVMLLESPRGRFARRLRLPAIGDMDGLTTQLADGELLIRIPKRAPRSIQVAIDGGGAEE